MTKSDDWVDNLLRQKPLQPVTDDGFTKRLIARLPMHPTQPPRWPVFSLMAVGVAAACCFMDIDSASQAIYRVLSLREISWVGVMPLLAALASCVWAIAESASDDAGTA